MDGERLKSIVGGIAGDTRHDADDILILPESKYSSKIEED